MSNKAKFWIGVVLALPTLFVAGVISAVGAALAEAAGGGSGAGSAVSIVFGLVLLALFVAACVSTRTRWFALGILAGSAILLIVAAGACVVLLVVLFGGWQ
jgi:hypothetical protein